MSVYREQLPTGTFARWVECICVSGDPNARRRDLPVPFEDPNPVQRAVEPLRRPTEAPTCSELRNTPI